MPITAAGTSMCSGTPSTNVCSAPQTRWTFRDGRCQPFSYGGCGSEPNNFRTADDCKRLCDHQTPGMLIKSHQNGYVTRYVN